MQRRLIKAIVLVPVMILLAWASLFLRSSNVRAATAQFIIPPSLSTNVTPTTNASNTGLDPAIVGALITAGATVLAALIGGAFLIFQVRKNDAQNLREEDSKSRRYRSMSRKYALAYRDALHSDPHIARLQILDMNRPLEVTDIYIRLRLHQETRPSYELDPALHDTELRRDPNDLLKAGYLRLESRASTAMEPGEAIRTYKHCVIMGDPGAGKTTLLKYLALQSVDNQLPDLPGLPIHVELNAFASSGHPDLLEFAASIWEERYGFPQAEALNYIKTSLQEGKALLLLDALDETVTGKTKEESEEAYKHAANAIMDLAIRYHEAPIAVTARKAGYHQRTRLAGFTELEVLDFRPEDIQQFVNRWFSCHPNPQKRANASDLNSRLERNLRIQSLAANPLLLSLIVIVYEDQLDLPDRRAELYRRCVDTLLTKWDASRDIRRRREFKPEHKQQLLEEVAWHFHQQGQRYFPEEELLRVIAEFLPAVGLSAEQNALVLAEIAAENGLLKEQARGWHGFLHLSLQEYFAAQYAVDHNQLDTLLVHRGEPWWEEVILLYAGRAPDASPLLQIMLGKDSGTPLQEDIFYTNLILAGRCLATRPTVREVSLRKAVVSQLFANLKETSFSLTQEQIANTLAEIGGGEVNKDLLSLFFNKKPPYNWRTQQVDSFLYGNIADAIGTMGDRSVIPELLRLLANERLDYKVRMSIALAIGRMGDCSIAPELLRLLADEKADFSVHGLIADAIGRMGDCSVVPELLRLVTSKQLNSGLRAHIARALGMLGDRSAIPELLRLVSGEQLDFSLHWNILIALGRLGDRSVVPELMHLVSREREYSGVGGPTAEVLGSLGDRSVVPELLRLLANERIDSGMRGRIAKALGSLGDCSVVPELLRLLASEQLSSYVRSSIAEALGSLSDRSVVPELLRLLASEQLKIDMRRGTNEQLKIDVRRGIAVALGKLGDRSIVPELLRLLANEQADSYERGRIAEALGQFADDETTVRTLASLLQNPDIADYSYRSLWKVSRRAGVRVFIIDGPEGKKINIVKWGESEGGK